jgi:hypothetical protein
MRSDVREVTSPRVCTEVVFGVQGTKRRNGQIQSSSLIASCLPIRPAGLLSASIERVLGIHWRDWRPLAERECLHPLPPLLVLVEMRFRSRTESETQSVRPSVTATLRARFSTPIRPRTCSTDAKVPHRQKTCMAATKPTSVLSPPMLSTVKPPPR